MKIAKQLKDQNVCEYLLYMWQVEDTIRAMGCDLDRIRTSYIPGFGLSEDEERDEVNWFENLIRMMREEGCTERGHLQLNQSTLMLLVDLHQYMLQSPKQPFYSAAYYKALPFIVELRARGGKEAGELETCFNCMYGVMMLRLQKREISEETKTAVVAISHLLALLADAYKKEKQGELEL
ncbi:MAG: DUF4924 family protein [Bacteroidaceae bacterium]|nr:DUF4924 family protein [Bacteroidaceae bacterium]